MRGYKISRNENGLYQFAFIPVNNGNQEIGESVGYKTHEECRKAMLNFVTFIKENKIDGGENKYVVIERKDQLYTNGYVFKYFGKDEKLLFFRNKPFSGDHAKQNCLKAIKNIYDNIDEYSDNLIYTK